jgi:hypothetical protein
MKPTIPKRELKVIIKRFLSDSDRGISQELFADLCGITRNHLLDVFIYKTEPLTEYVQRRVSKGYYHWLDGEVAIMANRDNTRFLEFRREAKPIMQKDTRLVMKNGKIGIQIGIKNKYDYSIKPLDEQ